MAKKINQKKVTIIETSVALFVELGEHGTPMSLISERAGTGMGTIYNYFESKEHLINECYLYLRQKQAEKISILTEDCGVKKKILQFSKENILYNIENPTYFFFLNHFHFSVILKEETRLIGNKIFEQILQVVAEGQRQGVIKNFPILELFNYTLGGIRSFVNWVLFEKIEIDEYMIERQLQIIWDSIKA